MKRNPSSAAIAMALASRESVANTLRAIEAASFEQPYSGTFEHERVEVANATLLDQAFFSEPLTDYAVGFRDDADLDAALEFYAPAVPVNRRFTYATMDNSEEFLVDANDERPIGADFKQVEYVSTKVDAKTVNRGLQIALDLDEIDGIPNWEEYYTQKLIRRIKRNSLKRAVALLSAQATNSGVTWDTTAGKDPDQDTLTLLITAADKSGVRPNRVGYGDTAWSKRVLAHRAQSSAGGFGSSALTPQALAGFLGVDDVQITSSRYTSSATAKTQIVANLVLLFLAESGVDTEDPSNIKRFISMGSQEQGGGAFQVYSQRVSAKRHIIAVGQYELTKITSTLGIYKQTVS